MICRAIRCELLPKLRSIGRCTRFSPPPNTSPLRASGLVVVPLPLATMFWKIGPAAAATGLPCTAPPPLSTRYVYKLHVYSRPPSSDRVSVPATACTTTSKRVPLHAPGGIAPVTSTTAVSMLSSSCLAVSDTWSML